MVSNTRKKTSFSRLRNINQPKYITVKANQNNQPISLNQIIDGMNVTFKIISSIKTQKAIKV